MDGEQNDVPIFRSDDIATAHSTKNKNNYFVRVTKNPILRLILRQKKLEEEKPPEAPKPVPVVQKRPKPQFRVTMRVSMQKLESEQKKHRKTVAILSFLLALSLAAAAFFAYNFLFSPSPNSEKIDSAEQEIIELRKELYDIVKSAPLSAETIESAAEQMDSVINLVPVGENRQSLKIYKLFLLTNENYNAEAVQYFESIKNEDYTSDQLCELYSYRLKISENSPNLSGNSAYEEKYNTLCTNRN